MTTTMPSPPPIGAPGCGSEPDPRPLLEPIFAALAARWASDGRTVPGESDEEWEVLVRRSLWAAR